MTSSRHYHKRYTNDHLLYISTEYTNTQQIIDTINVGLNKLNENIRNKTDDHLPEKEIYTKFKVNVVTRDNGELLKHAYLWVTNPEIYQIFLGNNPDGSSREKLIDDPDWVKGTLEEIAKLEEEMSNTRNWGDKEELNSQIEYLKHRPQIKVKLPNLIDLPLCEYTSKQRQAIYLERGPDITMDGVPTHFQLVVEQGYVNSVRDCYSTSVLKSTTKLPEFVTIKTLKQIFTPYIEHVDEVAIKKIGGKKIKGTYPLIYINNSRYAYVKFNETTNDALFALIMSMKIVVKDENTGKLETIKFYYAKR